MFSFNVSLSKFNLGSSWGHLNISEWHELVGKVFSANRSMIGRSIRLNDLDVGEETRCETALTIQNQTCLDEN